MSSFRIRSPGKVILHGEHAVVYQKPAIAAVVGLATTLTYRAQPEVKVASFQLEILNCTLEIQIPEFNNFLANFRSKYAVKNLDNTAKILEEARLEVARQLEIGNAVSSSSQHQHTHKAFISTYYLLAGAFLSAPEPELTLQHGFLINIDSELNLGAGLGSSAAFGAALATTFLILAGHFDCDAYLEPENQALISQWSFESERVMHGSPSGIDNTVCTYGGMLRFLKGQGFQQLTIQRPLNILLVDSHVTRSTADIVANVRHLGETFPRILNSIWKACEELVHDAIPLYESFGNGQDDSEKFEKIERLFQINNDLMKAIGVTHPKLEQIFAIAFKRGFFSKLTGAGAGGYAIVLLPENYESNQVYGKLKEELESAGFAVHPTTAGGVGLRLEQIEDETN